MGKVTLETIAEAAGISVPTVSLALSDHPRVKEATKKRVRQLCVQLGYRSQKEIQRRQRRKKLRKSVRRFTYFAVGPDAHLKLSSSLVSHLMMDPAVSKARIDVMAVASEDPAVILDHMCSCAAENDGFILYGRFDWPLLSLLRECGRPMVVVGPILGDLPADLTGYRVVSVDNNAVELGCHSTTALIEAGHRRIFLATDEGVPGLYYDRFLDGYRVALGRAGIAFDDTMVDRSGGRAFLENSAKYASTLFAADTAYVIPGRSIANRLRAALQHQGRELPLDKTFLCAAENGFESAGLADYARIETPERRLAERCVEALHGLLENRPAYYEQICLPFRTVNKAQLHCSATS